MASSFPALNWARLRVHGSGVSEVFDMDGRLWPFGSEQEAQDWLAEDDCVRHADLSESDEPELGRLLGTIRPPRAEDDAELLPQMFVEGSSAR